MKLNPSEYFEGEAIKLDEYEGVIVKFFGILEGRIPPNNLHEGSLFSGKWILPYDEDKAFAWKVGDKIRFKIDEVGTNLLN